MTMLKVDDKGALTLDGEILDHLGITPGQEVEAKLDAGGRVVLSAKSPERQPRTGRIEDVFGMLSEYYDGPPLTVEELNNAIADAAAGRRR
ncbi:AbrB/MazE/SpoVT family DNA-binding domain-containing protein [Jiella mangrovi]|uniref:AbrB/MazE/SpoVT family DNA-binding domain-containing protein n=1 Tax=Jiella mangrovi TaxID=2821407 RepID=A0ABS4BBF7_9HYPH|nr:AbrB/MazE/SpoVT family DNA-binding domain-containing protein [Jiella mangrovi]MBP0614069.1 AbrB/MazE/SpoVT family DNA-binding domain-containing protein [Jiella mangrovi]